MTLMIIDNLTITWRPDQDRPGRTKTDQDRTGQTKTNQDGPGHSSHKELFFPGHTEGFLNDIVLAVQCSL